MPNTLINEISTFLGTIDEDQIINGFENGEGDVLSEASNNVISANGREGDDDIATGLGNDLAAGDMVGNEWTLVDGKWVFNADALVVSDFGADKTYNDTIVTGLGDDVLLGNGGNDSLMAGAGEDIINAGKGDDIAFGGEGDDTINLEDGNDYVEAGFGNDIVNGGDGTDVICGDLKEENLISETDDATTFEQLAEGSEWTIADSYGDAAITHSAQTVAGETYTISFELAANLAAQYASATVEILWNGDVVDTVTANSGAYETFEVDVISTGSEGELTFRAIETEGSSNYNFDGPIVSYTKEVEIGGEMVEVAAFAAGQAKLYQVIDGQLNVFDVADKAYSAVGAAPSFKTNAVGFNVEDDLIYGVAKSNGVDSLGKAVSTTDIVMIDAAGATYRIGEGYYGDYVGDFDDKGNLWTFHSSLDRVSVVDVDNIDADGNPAITFYKFAGSMFTDRTFDLAYNAAENSFMAVVAPSTNGGNGKVVKIDLSQVEAGGMPTFTEIAITGTLYGEEMKNGMAKGAYGAVFFDGEGNLYYGLNRGDHDLEQSTGIEGGIFKVNVDWEAGQAFAEFMSEAPSTGSNDGAVDPRSADAFAEVDADAAVLLRSPTLTQVDEGNDILRGGNGNDEIHGNQGGDEIAGGSGEDALFGDDGDDLINGGTGNDQMSGGAGEDKMRGEADNDAMSGNGGNDFLDGGAGDDMIEGGSGSDKIVGGAGSDLIDGGAGDDNLWGGNWAGDDTADTFMFEAGTGKDYVHDFEADVDVLDFSAFATNFTAVEEVSTDLGWATVIDLQKLDVGLEGDRVVLKSVELSELDQDNFIF